MKLKYIQAHKMEDVPDHIIEEVTRCAIDMGELLLPIVQKENPNVALAALNFVHASLVKYLVSDDPKELEKAARLSAVSLVKNIEALIRNDQRIWDDNN